MNNDIFSYTAQECRQRAAFVLGVQSVLGGFSDATISAHRERMSTSDRDVYDIGRAHGLNVLKY